MSTPTPALNLFPARAAIGRADASGAVYMTPEFSRALAGLLARVGGELGTSTTDLEADTVLDPALSLVGALAQQVEALQLELAMLRAQLLTGTPDEPGVEVPLLARVVDEPSVEVPTPTDWEHPGKIGAAKANSGKFTTVAATSYNNVALTTPAALATLTLGSGKTFAVPNTLTFAGVDGKTLTLSNTLTLAGTDGATLNVGGGGTLGSAAFTASTAYVAAGSLGSAAFTASTAYAPAGGGGFDMRVGAFGCNGANPTPAQASGGTLAGVIAALVKFGMLSS